MLYLHVSHLSKTYTDRPILSDVNMTILKGQKVALVAKNGAGKTTLLSILKGITEPSDGIFTFHKGITVTFLDQQFDAPADMSVHYALYTHQDPVWLLIQQYEQALNNNDADSTHVQSLLHQIEAVHWREHETRVKTIISQLQLNTLLDKEIWMLSGGELKRVALAKALMGNPDMLILDEPTNHLDLDMIERLEKELKKSTITLLIITHDRYFLERVCSDIYELDRWCIQTYPGNYQYYLEKKAEREALEAIHVHKMKQQYRSELERVRKAPRGRWTKSVEREQKFYTLQQQFQQDKTTLRDSQQQLIIESAPKKLWDKVCKVYKLSKSFGDQLIIRSLTHDFQQGERIGIIGRNGVGKSTLIRLLMNEIELDSGSIQRAPHINVWYYQQHHPIPDTHQKMIDYVKDQIEFGIGADGKKIGIWEILERFLFTSSHQQSPLSWLSGGEKRRLHLMLVIMRNPQVLIMDEPTNDLDIMTISVLEWFLLAFTGCLIIISHDRFLMDRLVNTLIVCQWQGEIKRFDGTYSQYKQQPSALVNEVYKPMQSSSLDLLKKSNADSPWRSAPKKLWYMQQREFDALSIQIEQIEHRQEEINLLFQTQTLSHDDLKILGKELSDLSKNYIIKEQRRMELLDMSEW